MIRRSPRLVPDLATGPDVPTPPRPAQRRAVRNAIRTIALSYKNPLETCPEDLAAARALLRRRGQEINALRSVTTGASA